MDPQEFDLYRDAVQKYGPLKFNKLAPRQLRENFVSRLEAFIPPCGPCLMVTEIWGPVIALQNLAGTLSHVPSDVSRMAYRTGPLRDAWSEVFDAMIANHRLDDVRRWLQFLQTLCASSSSANRGITSPAKTIVLSSITHFLFACLKLQGYSLCYWFNEAGGALGFIGNIWYLQAERSAPLPGTAPAKILHFALLSWARDMYDTKGEDPAKACYTQRLMAETKKDLHELTYAALSYLLRDTEEKAREAIVSHLVVLLLISRHDAAQQLLLAQDALHIVTRALVCVVRPRSAPRDEALDEAVISGCTYLQKCINMGDGLSCIVRAFEAGFLTALLSGFHDPAHSQSYAVLAALLPSYLMHLSVVRAAAKALKKIRKLGIEKHMDRRGPIIEAWSIFKKVLEERIEVAGKTVHLKCANKQCNRIDFTDDCLRYCLGCMDCAYCSSECQIYDWRTGSHRKLCKETRTRRKEGQKIKLSSESTSFVYNVLERERILKALEVAEMVYRTRSLAVEFDYTVFPMKLNPCDTLEDNPSYTLVQMKLPAGQHSHLLRVKYPMPQDLADSVTLQGVS